MLPGQAEMGRHRGLASGCFSSSVALSLLEDDFLGLVSELGLRGELLAAEAAEALGGAGGRHLLQREPSWAGACGVTARLGGAAALGF